MAFGKTWGHIQGLTKRLQVLTWLSACQRTLRVCTGFVNRIAYILVALYWYKKFESIVLYRVCAHIGLSFLALLRPGSTSRVHEKFCTHCSPFNVMFCSGQNGKKRLHAILWHFVGRPYPIHDIVAHLVCDVYAMPHFLLSTPLGVCTSHWRAFLSSLHALCSHQN